MLFGYLYYVAKFFIRVYVQCVIFYPVANNAFIQLGMYIVNKSDTGGFLGAEEIEIVLIPGFIVELVAKWLDCLNDVCTVSTLHIINDQTQHDDRVGDQGGWPDLAQHCRE